MNQAAESAQRHSEWQARRIAELECEDERSAARQYETHLHTLQAQFATERDAMTTDMEQVRKQAMTVL